LRKEALHAVKRETGTREVGANVATMVDIARTGEDPV
jgi:hypothetical protein